MIITGEQFNKMYKYTFVAFSTHITPNQELTHFCSFAMNFGLNKVPHEEFGRENFLGGYHFTYLESYPTFLRHWFRVEIPDNARVIAVNVAHFKTDKLIILEEIEQIPEICVKAIKRRPSVLEHVKKQTTEMCMVAVQQNGYALQHVKEQTPEICKAAVQQNGYALLYVKEQTPEICKAAVQENGWALRYVKNQTPEIHEAAIKRNSEIRRYIIGGVYIP